MKYNPAVLRQSGYSIGYGVYDPQKAREFMENKDLGHIDRKYNSEKEWRLMEEWGQTYDEKMKSWETCKRVLRSGFQNFLMFGHKEKGLFWFRFKHNNKGFHVKNTKLHPLLFGERIGKTGFSIGNWHFKWLKKYEG